MLMSLVLGGARRGLFSTPRWHTVLACRLGGEAESLKEGKPSQAPPTSAFTLALSSG